MSTLNVDAIVSSSGGNTATVNGNLPLDKTARFGRNLIINGAMQVAQRATSAAGVGASSGYFTCDRWEIETGNSAGRLSMAQNNDSPDGFNNSISLACTTADPSIASNEYFRLQQVIEAQNLQSLAKGTSSAKQFTLSFYVKGNAAATYGIEIYDLDNTRHICSTFNVTTSWNRVSITFAGDTTGAINDDNGGGFQVGIYLHAGSDYNSGTLSTSWASITTANRTSNSNTSFYDSTNRTFFITGVQLEVGDSASDFEYRSFGEELQLCKRYFHTYGGTNAFEHLPFLGQGSGSTINFNHELPVEMRATPTLSQSGSWQVNDGYLGAYYTLSSVALDNLSTKLIRGSATTSSAIGGDIGRIIAYNDINARWSYSAEL